jgi:DNA-binding NarL/FixJ family response regulator
MSLTIYFATPREGAAMFAASSAGEAQNDGNPGGENPIQVMIVEDHRVVAEGLAALINHQGDMRVVGEASTVAQCIAAAAEFGPDVVVLDFRLPDGTGADAAAGIRQIRPEAKLIFLTREDSDSARFAAVQSGASAFIHKSKAASEVVAAIRDVARGRMLITPRTIATLLAKRRAIDAQLESLTMREKEVLRLIAQGLSSRSVAAKLGIGYTTVRSHIRSLGSKLGVHSKLEAIVKARELGLIS